MAINLSLKYLFDCWAKVYQTVEIFMAEPLRLLKDWLLLSITKDMS